MTNSTAKIAQNLADQRPAIHRYIHSMVRDAAEAEDLTQETMLRAHSKLPTLDDPSRLVHWLYRIATNICYDQYRRVGRKSKPKHVQINPDGTANTPDAEALTDNSPRLDKAMAQKEMSACVQSYLAALPDAYRAAIMLHDVHSLTNPQIAEMLDLSLATVKVRLHRARKQLRDALEAGCSLSHNQRGVLECEPKPRQNNG